LCCVVEVRPDWLVFDDDDDDDGDDEGEKWVLSSANGGSLI
jgi:hypothetical protein